MSSPAMSLKSRWWAKVDKNGPLPERNPELGCCWIWLGEIDKDGPAFTADGKRVRAYRYGYELFNDDIPEWLDLDHLCNNHDCVNPHHGEPVTRSENVRRQHEHRRWKRAQWAT